MFPTWDVLSQVWALESGSFLILHRFHSTFIWKEIWFNQLSSVTRIPNYWHSMSSQASGDLKFRLNTYKFTIRNTVVPETVLKRWPVWSQVTVKMLSWELRIRAKEAVSDDTAAAAGDHVWLTVSKQGQSDKCQEYRQPPDSSPWHLSPVRMALIWNGDSGSLGFPGGSNTKNPLARQELQEM